MIPTRSLAVAAAMAALPLVQAQQEKPTLYVVPYAHLDTQWRWSYPQVIREFLWNTMQDNFRLFDKYPDYTFNFGGSRRFEMMREYFPEEYRRVVQEVKKGRWFPAPASVDETECNVISGESVIRNVLYGNLYSKREFGVTSEEFMRPDSFGFPYSLPTLLVHAGLKGFSTQKLSWGSAVGVPFNVGVWQGPDGSGLVSALNATSYGSSLDGDASRDARWLARVQGNPVPVDYRYYGTGDRGGAPAERSVANGELSVKGDGPLKIVQGGADAMFKALTPAQIARLPRYRGELLLTQHSAGSLTSHAEMKRWNRQNELLADLAERTSVAASLFAQTPYPLGRLNRAWDLTLGSQMHDMLPGTCLPKAYEYAQNDEVIAQKEFSDVATSAVASVAAQMDTRGKGVSLVVVNPLSVERNDVVEAWIPQTQASDVAVTGPDGKRAFAQIVGDNRPTGPGRPPLTKIVFLAKVPANGFAVYDVEQGSIQSFPELNRGGPSGFGAGAALPLASAQARTLENGRFRATLNAAGDLASLYDKRNKREALKAPATLDLQHENPRDWPAWNMDWEDQRKAPYATVGGKATICVVESGPVRATLEVVRKSNGSKFTQRYSLTHGGDRLEIEQNVDWGTRETALKAAFPLASANPKATYGMQVGAIERGNNREKAYEAPLHGWMDLTAPDGGFGVGVLSPTKFGSDKPSDDVLRLTLLYTPGTHGGYEDQGVQDFGRHSILTGLAPHAGDWRTGGVHWNAQRLAQPLRAFVVSAHPGRLGRSLSLAATSDRAVEIMALKRAEDGDGLIVRLRETTGRDAGGVGLRLASSVVSAEEVDGQERRVGPAKTVGGKVVADLKGYGLRAYRVRLAQTRILLPQPVSTPIPLSFDADATDVDGARSYDAATFPARLSVDNVAFRLGAAGGKAKNALRGGGRLALPKGTERVEMLVAADEDGAFRFGTTTVAIPRWRGYVGQSDTRLWKGEQPELTYGWSLPWAGLAPGYVKPAEIAWFSSHHRLGDGKKALYEYSYLYKVGLDVSLDATSLSLPKGLRVFAATAVRGLPRATPAASLHDTLEDHRPGDAPRIAAVQDPDGNGALVTVLPPLYWHDGIEVALDNGPAHPYDGPFRIGKSATIRALLDGREAVLRVETQDRVPPTLKAASASGPFGLATLRFSEEIDRASALDPAGYAVNGERPTSVGLSSDGRTVDLLFPPRDGPVVLTMPGVHDLAGNRPAAREVAPAPLAPLFVAPRLEPSTAARFESAAPTGGREPWTLNLWLLVDAQPQDRTLIAGFGNATDGAKGTGRYLAKFRSGLQFWSAQEDVPTNVPLDLHRWQMLTATYDGATLRVYKNGRLLATRDVALGDDVSTVHVLPLDAWDHARKVAGEVQGLTLWGQALPPKAVESLFAAGRA